MQGDVMLVIKPRAQGKEKLIMWIASTARILKKRTLFHFSSRKYRISRFLYIYLFFTSNGVVCVVFFINEVRLIQRSKEEKIITLPYMLGDEWFKSRETFLLVVHWYTHFFLTRNYLMIARNKNFSTFRRTEMSHWVLAIWLTPNKSRHLGQFS